MGDPTWGFLTNHFYVLRCIAHEPTLTLIFKGSKSKQAVLDEALSALQPRGARPLKFGRSEFPNSGFGSGGFGARSDLG